LIDSARKVVAASSRAFDPDLTEEERLDGRAKLYAAIMLLESWVRIVGPEQLDQLAAEAERARNDSSPSRSVP
jgi:hypothetical protein